jgi:hypothetical protein
MASPRSRLVTWPYIHLCFSGRRFWRPHPDLDRAATPALPPGRGRPLLWGSFACLPPLWRLLSGPRCRPGAGAPEPLRCAGEPRTEPVRPAPPAPRARSTGTVRSIAPAASVPHGLSPPGSPMGARQPRLALWDEFLCRDRFPGQCRRGGVSVSVGALGRCGRRTAGWPRSPAMRSPCCFRALLAVAVVRRPRRAAPGVAPGTHF